MASVAELGEIGSKRAGRWIPAWTTASIIGGVLLAIVAVFVIYPLWLIVLQSVQLSQPGDTVVWGLNGWETMLKQAGMQAAALNTLTVTVARSFLAMPIALFIAWLIARTDLPGRNWFEFAFWLAFFLPSLTVTLSWIVLLDPEFGLLNLLLRPLGLGPMNIYSAGGIVWVHMMSTAITVKVMLLTPVVRNMNSTLEEASYVSGASPLATLPRIVGPVMIPAILAVLLISVMRALEAFEIEQILGPPAGFYVLSTKMYDSLKQFTPRYNEAAAMGVIMLVAMFLLVIVQRQFTAGRHYTTLTGQYQGRVLRLGRWRWPAFGFMALVVSLVLCVPLVFSLVGTLMKLFGFFSPDAWTLKHWQTALTDRNLLRSLQNTLVLGLATAAVAVMLHGLVAYVIVRTRFFGRRALDLISWLPFTIPGILLSLGLLGMFLNLPFLRPLYGSLFALVAAGTIAGMPLAVQILKANLMQLSADLEEASWMAGGTWWHTYRKVVLPLISPTLVVVGLISFMSAARNISHVVLLSNASNRPLSIMQLDYMADGKWEVAAVIACLLMFVTLGLAIAARVFGYRGAVG